MSQEVNIQISEATETLSIGYYPEGIAIIPEIGATINVQTSPNSKSINIDNAPIYSINNTVGNQNLGFDTSNALSVTLGTILSTPLLQELDAFKYNFNDFIITNSDDLSVGDIVYFTTDNSAEANSYGTKLLKASTSNTSSGAYNNLMIFLSYNNGSLTLIHKGYFDYETTSSNISGWSPGRTLYLDGNNKLSTIPSTAPGSWVRSLGFCIPNTLGKYRVWFEADSTYLKLA